MRVPHQFSALLLLAGVLLSAPTLASTVEDECPLLLESEQESIRQELDQIRPMGLSDKVPLIRSTRADFRTPFLLQSKQIFESIKFQAFALGLIRGEEDEENFVQAYSNIPSGELRQPVRQYTTVIRLDADGKRIDKQPPRFTESPSGESVAVVSCPNPYAVDVATHEIFHWLQHHRWTTLHDDPGSTDAQLGRSALVEGDATLMGMMQSHSFPFEYFQRYSRRAAEAFSDWNDLHVVQAPYLRIYFSEIPAKFYRRDGSVYVLRDLFFPHIYGRAFVQEAWKRGGAEGVDRLYRDLGKKPLSSEQILHPEKYFDPQQFDPPHAFPEIISRNQEPLFQQDVLGEWMIYAWLASYIGQKEASIASEGWDGDRFALSTETGKLSYILETNWDTAKDAEEFTAALRKVLRKRLGENFRFGMNTPKRYALDRGSRRAHLLREGRSVKISEELPCSFCKSPEKQVPKPAPPQRPLPAPIVP